MNSTKLTIPPKQNKSISSYFEFHHLIKYCECTFHNTTMEMHFSYFCLYFFYLQLFSRGNPAKEHHKHNVFSLSLLWWHSSANSCQMIMSTRQMIMSTCQMIMSTCQMINVSLSENNHID